MRSRYNPFSLLIFFICCTTLTIQSIDIDQSDIPFIITDPGTYNLTGNVEYRGHKNAITIKADNVVLNLNAFSIFLAHNHAIGVFGKNISNVTISNGSIENEHSHSNRGSGIHLTKTNKGIISNIATVNNHNGLFIKESHNIAIDNSAFFHATKSGTLVKDSTAVSFDGCVFADCNNGLTLKGANKDVSVMNSEFPSAEMSNLYVQRVNGMIIEKCNFTNQGGSSAKANLVQFGDAHPSQTCNDVIMKNCTVVNRPSHTPVLGNTSPEGIGIYQGSGFLVDSCVIDIDNTNQDPAADLSGIHISNPGLGISGTIAMNVIVSNCIIQGPATDGIYPDVGSSGVLLENNLVANALKDGIFLAGTTASTVINNTVVNNGTNGIFLGEASSFNAVINNVVDGNGFNPILSSIPPIGNGIGISSDSFSNIVQGNTVFNNAVNGIDDEGTNNEIFNNTAFANGNTDYFAATDTIIISSPGDYTLVGGNLAA